MKAISDNTTLRVMDAGDSALRALIMGEDRIEVWKQTHSLCQAIEDARISGVHGLAPTYDAILIEFDPLFTTHDAVRQMVHLLNKTVDASSFGTSPRHFHVPVVYGGKLGPDLDTVAEQLGLSPNELIDRHSQTSYVMRCFGAPAGSPMMDGPPLPAPVPRLSTPRLKVPSRSVEIAGRQGIIVSLSAPSGWPVIGQTPLEIVDITAPVLTPYRAGDIFTFEPITMSRWDEFAGHMLKAHDD